MNKTLKFSHIFCLGVNDFKNIIHICAALQSIPLQNQVIRALVRNTCSSSKWTTPKYTMLMNCSLVCLARHSVNEAQQAATFESCDFEGNHLVVK